MSSDKQYFFLTLIRHGETNENVQGIIQGCKDTKLNKTGINQTRSLAQSINFNSSRYNKIFSSDLMRAYDTCRILFNLYDEENQHSNIITDALLRERSFGVLEGKHQSELFKLLRQTGHSMAELTVHGGESIPDVKRRVKIFFEDRILAKCNSSDDILIVSHGGVIRQMIEYLVEFSTLPFDASKVSRIPPNTSLSEFKVIFSNQQIINVECIRMHDISHLDPKIRQQALNQPQLNANVEM